MANCNELIICEQCDCVFEKAALTRHQTSLCSRCGSVLQRFNGLAIDQRLALTITAAVLWLLANLYSVMSISLQGLKSSTTLWDSILALSIGPMSTLELFLLGALVAVFELAGMLDVLPGIGLFALAVLSLLLIRRQHSHERVLEFWQHGAWRMAHGTSRMGHRADHLHCQQCRGSSLPPCRSRSYRSTRQPMGSKGALKPLLFHRTHRLLVDARRDRGGAGGISLVVHNVMQEGPTIPVTFKTDSGRGQQDSGQIPQRSDWI